MRITTKFTDRSTRSSAAWLIGVSLLVSGCVPWAAQRPTTVGSPEIVEDVADPKVDPVPEMVAIDVAAGVDVEFPPRAERVVDVRAATAIPVADPRPGDLRTDPTSDGLPADYVARRAVPMQEIAYGTDPAQRLDLYLPDAAAAPVVVYLHPGGWVSGDKSTVPEMVLRFVEKGYAVASVGYRLAPEHTFPAQLHDAKHAIRWLKAYGARYGLIDGNRMVVFGASAGGHIASLVAATPGSFEPPDLTAELEAFDSSVVGLVSAVGPTDLVTFYEPTLSDATHPWRTGLPEALLGCSPCDIEHLADASPITHLGDDLPPAYWAYGEHDTDLVHPETQGAVIADVWAEHAGAGSSWFDYVDGAGHNFDQTFINQRAVESFIDMAVAR